MKRRLLNGKRILSAVMTVALLLGNSSVVGATETAGQAAGNATVESESTAGVSQTSASSTAASDAAVSGTDADQQGNTAAGADTQTDDTQASGTQTGKTQDSDTQAGDSEDSSAAESSEASGEESISEEDSTEISIDGITSGDIIFVDDIVYINPCYADVITADDLVESPEAEAPDLAAVAAVLANEEDDSSYSSSDSEVASQICAQMIARTETFTVYYRTDKATTETYKSIMSDLFSLAQSHTGAANAGDYLKWTNGGYTGSIGGYVQSGTAYLGYTYTVTYYTTADQEAELTSKVSGVFGDLGISGMTTDYEKVKAIYQYICNHVTYDYTNLNDDDYKLKYTAYAALINGTAVCQGYSTLFYYMALTAGINARFISGNGNGQRHGWNIVHVGSYYYNLDSTWDSNYSDFESYQWFLKSDADFTGHERDADYSSSDFYAAYPMAGRSYLKAPDVTIVTKDGETTDVSPVFYGPDTDSNPLYSIDLAEIDSDRDCLYQDTSGNYLNTMEDGDDYLLLVNEDGEITQIEDEKVTPLTISLSLQGKIQANYKLELNSTAAADPDGCMYFYLMDENGNRVEEQYVDVKDATQSGDYYYFCFKLKAASMADTIHAEYHGSQKNQPYVWAIPDCSVADYAARTEEAYPQTTELINAMLNYGAASQTFFGYNTENLANAGLAAEDQVIADVSAETLAPYKFTAEGSSLEGLTLRSASLVLQDSTTIRIFCNLTGTKAITDYTASLVSSDGSTTPLTWQEGSTGYYVAIENIAAADLDTMYTIVFSDGTNNYKIQYSALGYAYAVINSSSTSAELKNVCKAMYAYNQAANAYFGR